MKTNIFVLILICSFLSSCTVYYFSEPQPVDSKNTYKIPKKFRGSWHLNNEDDNKDSLSIGKNFYHRTTESLHKESKQVLEKDSNTYFINNEIYHNENGKLEGGFSYEIQDDSVIISVVKNELIEFGKKAFLRKIDYGYILNINHEEMTDWWEIKFIDIRSKESFVIRELSEKDLENEKDYMTLHSDFEKYIIAKWSREKMKNFIDIGGFSDTTLILKYKEKLSE